MIFSPSYSPFRSAPSTPSFVPKGEIILKVMKILKIVRSADWSSRLSSTMRVNLLPGAIRIKPRGPGWVSQPRRP